jgi:hypothetical protein
MSKEFTSDVRTDAECGNIPSEAKFVLFNSDAIEIRKLQKFLQDNGLYQVEKFDYRVEWLDNNGEDTRTDSDCLHVSQTDFWFSAYLKHTNTEILTDRYNITIDLALLG